MPQKEFRSFSRIKTRIKALVRKTDASASQPLFHANQPEVQFADPTALKEANLPEGLKSFLQTINDKLDMLLAMLSQKSLENDYPFQTEVLELSGAGLKCAPIDDSFKVGEYVEMVLVLSNIPIKLACINGLIQRQEKLEGATVLAVEFTSLRDSDREAIVQFVFQEQREQIRKNKYE